MYWIGQAMTNHSCYISGIGNILGIASIAVGSIEAVFRIIINAGFIYYLYRPT